MFSNALIFPTRKATIMKPCKPHTKTHLWFCSARSDSTNSISLACHAFFMCCMRCHDAMMPCLCAYLFLLLAVLLAAACLVVEVAAGPVYRLLLTCLFCEFLFFFLVLVVMPRWPCLGEGDLPLPFPPRVRALPPEWGVALPLPPPGAPERDPAAAMLGPQPIPAPFPNWKLRPQKEIAALKEGRASLVQHLIPGRGAKRARIWPSLPGCRAEEVVQQKWVERWKASLLPLVGSSPTLSLLGELAEASLSKLLAQKRREHIEEKVVRLAAVV